MMKTINVEGLPEPVVRAMEIVVDTVRKQLHADERPPSRDKLPVWPGKVLGSMSRTEIYEDARLNPR
jgi:hypothetical protein